MGVAVQTPIYIITSLGSNAARQCAVAEAAAAAAAAMYFSPSTAAATQLLGQQQHHDSPEASSAAAAAAAAAAVQAQTAASAAAATAAAELPWLLLLARMMVLRGKLLGHLLLQQDHQGDAEGAASTLHHAYWHIRMAQESAACLAAHLTSRAAAPRLLLEAGTSYCGSNSGNGGGCSSSSSSSQRYQHQLLLLLLPALKQAVHMFKAAMKLSRHYHETGFASGFASGFAAGYAAALAAAGGTQAASPAVAAPAPVAFASPWGVLQQGCIRALPQQLEVVGAGLAEQLNHLGCSNPLCVNLSWGSELWLLGAGSSSDGGSINATEHDGHGGCGSSGSGSNDTVQGKAGLPGPKVLCRSCRRQAG